MIAYLSGPIEFAGDSGKLWRRKLAPFLRDTLGHRVYDPAEDEKKNLTDEEVKNFREWKITDFERYRRAVRKIIRFDLDMVENRASYLICVWEDPNARSGGTPAEVTTAFRRGIPVYLVSALPREQISGWLLACSDRVFRTVEELKEFLLAQYAPEKKSSRRRR
jgi:hypothetical protein